jgi:nucleoside-diphosphate-sugar epimerase
MRLLVLGGTRFVGHAIAMAGVGHGWEVTTFNREISGADVPGVRVLRGDSDRGGSVAYLSAATLSFAGKNDLARVVGLPGAPDRGKKCGSPS